MKREGDRPCAAPRRERPAPVHPLYQPAEVVAVAVAEPVDGVDAREQKDIKTRGPSFDCPKTMCGQCRSGMVPRRKRKRTTTRRRTHQRGGFVPLILMAGKALVSSALSSGAKYGVKKALEKPKKKKINRPAEMTFEEELAIRRAFGL